MKKTRYTSTQDRIALPFTLLFLLAAIILTTFLKISIDAISYNSQARTIYAEIRQLHQAKIHLQQFRRALSYYEITIEQDFLDEYNSSYSQLEQYFLNAAQYNNPAEDDANLQQLGQEIQELRGKYDLAIAAADNEDWETVIDIENDSNALVEQIFGQIDALVETRTQELSDLRARVDNFASLGRLAIFIAAALFLLLIGFVALTIASQINGPLIRMTDELKQVEANRFEPSILSKLPERHDEIGYLAREYLQMAGSVQERQAVLQQEADEIRAKIR